MDKSGRELGRADVIIREPGRGLLWGAGILGCTETFHSEAARQAARPAPEKAAHDNADEGRVHELLEELLGDTDS